MQAFLARVGFISWMGCAYACILALSMMVADEYMWLRGPGFFVVVTGVFTVIVVAILWMRGEAEFPVTELRPPSRRRRRGRKDR